MNGYDNLVNSFGYEIVYQDADDDYQGDMYYLLKDFRRVGFLVAGFGSCSYCDAYESADKGRDYNSPWFNHEPLRELANELYHSIKWFTSVDEAIGYINTTNHYWSHTSIKAALLGALNKLKEQTK